MTTTKEHRERDRMRKFHSRERPKFRGPFACGHPNCPYSFGSKAAAAAHRIAKHEKPDDRHR